MPPEQALDISHFAKGSLLTLEQIQKSLLLCNNRKLDFVGGKISLNPNDATVNERILYINDLCILLDHAVSRHLI